MSCEVVVIGSDTDDDNINPHKSSQEDHSKQLPQLPELQPAADGSTATSILETPSHFHESENEVIILDADPFPHNAQAYDNTCRKPTSTCSLHPLQNGLENNWLLEGHYCSEMLSSIDRHLHTAGSIPTVKETCPTCSHRDSKFFVSNSYSNRAGLSRFDSKAGEMSQRRKSELENLTNSSSDARRDSSQCKGKIFSDLGKVLSGASCNSTSFKKPPKRKKLGMNESAARQQKRIAEKFENFHASYHEARRGDMYVLLTSDFEHRYAEASEQLRLAFSTRFKIADTSHFPGAVRWCRRSSAREAGSPDDHFDAELSFVTLVLDADSFCAFCEASELPRFAEDVRLAFDGSRVEIVVLDLMRHCSSARCGRRSRQRNMSVPSLQDSFMRLYLSHGLKTRSIPGDELGSLLISTADCLAREQRVEKPQFLDTNLKYLKQDVGGRVTCEGVDGRIRIQRSSELGVVYLNLLVQIPGISLEKAKAIRKAYPTLWSLLSEYELCTLDSEREKLLEDLKYGSSEKRRIGRAASRLVANVLTSREPSLAVRNFQTSEMDPVSASRSRPQVPLR